MKKRLKPLEQMRKFERVAYAMVSLSIITIGTFSLASGSFGWGSWLGGLVFPPILIVVGSCFFMSLHSIGQQSTNAEKVTKTEKSEESEDFNQASRPGLDEPAPVTRRLR